MGIPSNIHRIDLDNDSPAREGIAVSMGNPHLVIFVEDLQQIDLTKTGSRLEHHPHFPDRVNVEFAQILNGNRIRMRVWERGSGITQACGTGACATAAAAVFTKRCGRKADVIMDGGILHLYWDEESNCMMMNGPAVKVFDGTIDI